MKPRLPDGVALLTAMHSATRPKTIIASTTADVRYAYDLPADFIGSGIREMFGTPVTI